jgi:hypothetical protein
MTKKKVTDQQVREEHARGEKERLSERAMAMNLGIPQSTFVQKMKKIGLEAWNEPIDYERAEVRNLRVLYSISGNPGTSKDIMQRTGFSYNDASGIVDRLIERKRILSFKMAFGRRDTQSYRLHEIFDGITALNIFYVRGDEHLLGSYITGYLPREITLGMRKSLKYRLGGLPKDAFDTVCDYIDKHMVR